jgi:polar amino acid transport system substrate-binding protein
VIDVRAARRLSQGMLATLLIAAGLSVFSVSAGTLDEIKARGVMNIATEDDFHPFEFIQDGTPTGYDTELVKLITASAPFKLHQDTIPWAGILPGVTTGKYDMAVSAVLVTDARKKTLQFASPIAESTTYYLTKSGGTAIKSTTDLNGKAIGVEAGSAMEKQLQALDAKLKAAGGAGVKQIVEYQGYPEAYQDLALGRLDAVVNTEINLEALIKEKPGVFAMGQPIAEPVYIAWAAAKGNDSLIAYINSLLLAARKDGKMYELQKKWLGASFESMPETIQ